jgi:hypothetical protein
MTDKIFRLTKDNIGEYEIKFLPNVHNPSSPVIGLQTQFFNNHWVYVFFSYALINGEPKIFVFSKKLHPRQEFPSGDDLYSFVNGIYLYFKTFKVGEYIDYGEIEFIDYGKIEFKENDKYKYPIKSPEGKKTVMFLYDTFGNTTLEDVREFHSFKYAEIDSGVEGKKLKDIYKHDYKEFDKKYKIYLRNKKMLNIKKKINEV